MSLFDPQPHSSDAILAYCDGGSRGNPGPSGYGAVIADAAGRPLAELSEFLGIRTNNFAEYSGLLAVLAYALAHNHPRLKVVSDSELMVKQIQGKYKVNSPDLKPLWQEARSRIARLDAFEIAHALRHKNKEADALANAAMDRGTDRGMKRASPATSSQIPIQTSSQTRTQTRTQTPPARVQSLPLRPRPASPAPAAHTPPPPSRPAPSPEPSPTMHRGFTRNGTIHLLGGATLPDGIFVKIIRE